MWAVLYDDGTSLTTVSEPIAHSLAEAERQRGRHVTVRRLDDDVDGEPEPALEPGPTPAAEPAPANEPARTLEPIRFSGPPHAVEPTQAGKPASMPESASEAARPVPAREPEPARAARPTIRRRLLLYALTAVIILVAAALADHWSVLPRVGATTGFSPTQIDSPHRPQLLPPLDQPPVIHFGDAASTRPKPRPESATSASSRGRLSATPRGG
jgi:hypothetical protein